jgi:hypothetical protein
MNNQTILVSVNYQLWTLMVALGFNAAVRY